MKAGQLVCSVFINCGPTEQQQDRKEEKHCSILSIQSGLQCEAKSTAASSPYSLGYGVRLKGNRLQAKTPASTHKCPRGLGQAKTIIIPQRDVPSFRIRSLPFNTSWEYGSVNCVCQYHTLQTPQLLPHSPFSLCEKKDNFFSSSS